MSSWERSSKSVVLSKCKDRRSRCRSFTIACGSLFLPKDLSSLCDNSNKRLDSRNHGLYSSSVFSATPHVGGYAGGQAEYARVPFADVGLFKIPDGLTDEQVLFLTDIFLPVYGSRKLYPAR